MRHWLKLLMALALAASWPDRASAQTDFSGEWELVEGIPDVPLFREGRIQQDSGTLTIAPRPPNLLFEEPRVFRLDGTETLYVNKNVRGDEVWTRASRARWIGSTLEVDIVTTRSGERTSSWGSSMTMSVDEGGRLVIVRNEPTLQGTIAVLRAVYRRK